MTLFDKNLFIKANNLYNNYFKNNNIMNKFLENLQTLSTLNICNYILSKSKKMLKIFYFYQKLLLVQII